MLRVLCVTALVGLFGLPATAAEITVNSAAELTTALVAAGTDDTIVITPAGSPYVGNFVVPNGSRASIRGSTGDPADVVLDGGGSDSVLRYLSIGASSDPQAEILVEGLTLRNAARGFQATSFAFRGTLRIADCVIEDHVNTGSSAVAFNIFGASGGRIVFEDCVIRRNVAAAGSTSVAGSATQMGEGGGFFRCRFEDNRLETDLGSGGGAVSVGSYFEDCVFEDNYSLTRGGAVYVQGEGCVRCTFVGNTAGTEGGAVAGVPTRIQDCVFIDNTADQGGAFAGWGPEVMQQNVFVRNTALTEGGAIYRDFGSNLIQQNTFVDNDAPVGSTVGNIGNRVELFNNIIWNEAGQQSGLVSGSYLARFNVSSANLIGATDIRSDPLFVDPAAGDYRIGPGSPAIDAGSVLRSESDFNTFGIAAASARLTFDANGDPRVVDDPATPNTGLLGTAGPLDIGAFEFQAGPACIADVTTTNTNPGSPGYGEPDGTIDGNDLSYYVEQWLNGCP